ncbi:MAG: hypothetical protein K2P81_01250 [Bacteriovoracaceae bacterium]|nr:hypothetical protein [Bacteriovoracaceae bacterium]
MKLDLRPLSRTLIILAGLLAFNALAQEDCEKKFKDELQKLILEDSRGILGLQFKLTTLKMLKRTIASSSSTLEEQIKKDSQRLKDFNIADQTVTTKLETLYDSHARDDAKKVLEHYDSLKEKSVTASYWKLNTRLDNRDASTLILFDQLTNPDSGFDKMDVAITWLYQKLADEVATVSGAGSIGYNNLEISNQISRFIGAKKSGESIDQEIQDIDAVLNDFFKTSVASIKTNLASCIVDNKLPNGCELNEDTLSKEVASLLFNMDEVSTKLALNSTSIRSTRTQGGSLVSANEDGTTTSSTNGGLRLTVNSDAASGGGTARPTRGGGRPTVTRKPASTGTPTRRSAPVTHPPGSKDEGHACHPDERKTAKILESPELERIEKAFEVLGQILKAKHAPKPGMHRAGERARKNEIALVEYNGCCNGKKVPVKDYEIRIAFVQSYSMRFFWGIPYGAELGVRGTVDVGVGGEFKASNPSCNQSRCGGIKVRIDPSLAVYAEVLADLGGIEGGVKWYPDAGLMLCGGDLEAKMKVGEILLYYKVTAGWVFGWEDRLEMNHHLGISPSAGLSKHFKIF